MLDPRCNGGECDKKDTCEHAIVAVYDDNKIYAVPKGKCCGFYIKYKPTKLKAICH
jgi:hypothetical protein